MNRGLIIFLMGIILSCNSQENKLEENLPEMKSGELDHNDKIKVLNLAIFHMGSTSDSRSVEFNEEDKKNQEAARQLAAALSRFQPTTICVEVPPSEHQGLNEAYQEYLSKPQKPSTYYGEVGLVAFELGRLNKIDRIYGIDHKLEYNYNINNEMENELDSATINAFQTNPLKSIEELNIFEEGIPLMEKVRRMNHPDFLDFLITANADILTHVGSENGFEGADEAAKYYQRNLRIYSNLNRIPLTKSDRVFILSGGSHAAFLNEFINRSPKYEVVNTLDYLK
jgi:hypothetical protein